MINLDSAYTPAIRSYDKSMNGLFSYSTPDSDKVGSTELTINFFNCWNILNGQSAANIRDDKVQRLSKPLIRD